MNVHVQTGTQSSSIMRRQTLRQWFEANSRSLNIATLAFVGVLCVSYIFQVTNTVAKGYELRELELTINELSLENELMAIEARKAQSLEHVSKSVKMLGFVEGGQPMYLDTDEASYALAE
jgi:hypothetical protein